MPNRSSETEGTGARAFRVAFAGLVVIAMAAIAGTSLLSMLGGDQVAESSAQGAPFPTYELQEDAAAAEAAEGPPRTGAAGRTALAADGPGRYWSGGGHRIVSVRRGGKVGVYERPGGKLIERVGPRTEFGSRRTFSVLHRKGRWLEVATPIAEDNRGLWIEADPAELNFYTTPLSLHASLSGREVELRRGEEVLRRFPVTVGAAGSRTPPGRFAVTDLIVGGLHPVYGCCAIALSAHQPELPEDWIGGDRIAIHGTTGPVGAAASTGCLRAPNSDAQAVVDRIRLGTPVFIKA